MPTQREKIKKQVRVILENSPKGIHYADLVTNIKKALPDTKENTIHGAVCDFKRRIDKGEIKDDVVRPERGLYILKKYLKEKEVEEIEEEISEELFYKPFADYLVGDLEECTKAVPLGGNKFKDKWGTPDVIGTYSILAIGHIQPPIEVISAEIKTNINQLIASFAQACCYKLFSHKVYLVIPKDSRGDDIKRIEALCLKFGIGLILFNRSNKENPEFEILTRSVKSEPDYFYLNRYIRLIDDVAQDLL